MLKTNKQIKKTIFTAVFAVIMIPTLASAGSTGSYGSDSFDYGGWGSGTDYSMYDNTYTPTYSYQPTYSDYYTSPSYGSNYGGSSYTPSSYYGGGSSYTPSYYTGGSSYSTPSSYYTSSVSPSSNYTSNTTSSDNKNNNTNNNANSNTNSLSNKNDIKNDIKTDVKVNNDVKNTNLNAANANSNSNSTSSSSAVAINNNNNNVYVYTNPTGNAVVYNPQHQYLNVYCVITPSNPRVGQTVTATAYASGGVGNYSYTWGGDINSASGPSTIFTSYSAGTKNITVTVRSDQEIITKSCNVTFENSNSIIYGNNYSSYTPSYYSGSSVNLTPGITSGTPVSGVYLSQLPATGLSLSFFDYMVATMVVILGVVFTFVYQARKRLTVENI